MKNIKVLHKKYVSQKDSLTFDELKSIFDSLIKSGQFNNEWYSQNIYSKCDECGDVIESFGNLTKDSSREICRGCGDIIEQPFFDSKTVDDFSFKFIKCFIEYLFELWESGERSSSIKKINLPLEHNFFKVSNRSQRFTN